MNWPLRTLREAGVSLIDCDHRTPPVAERGLPYVAIPQITDGRIDLAAARKISPEHFAEWTRKAQPQAYDVVLSRRCNPGETAYVAPATEFALGQNLVLLRASGVDLEPAFLRWLVRGPAWWEQVGQFRNVGAVFDSLKCIDVPKFKLPLPPKPVQRAIAQVLGALDDKIELNRRMSQTLGALAQAIFKSWFVDFDPVRAKAGGEAPESICERLGLSLELLALFPNGLADGVAGQAPAGWPSVTLKELTRKIGSGATPRGGREVYLDDGIALIRSQNVYDAEFAWHGLARISDEAAVQLANVELKHDDVLLNITGASILRTCVVPDDALPARVNQHVAIIRAKDHVPARYLHLNLLRKETKAFLLGLNAGASREAVTKAHIESVQILDPGPALLTRFRMAVEPLYAEVMTLAAESRTLGQLRDGLLPRLLSGELSVQMQRSAIVETA